MKMGQEILPGSDKSAHIACYCFDWKDFSLFEIII